jgi:hypothetical protein
MNALERFQIYKLSQGNMHMNDTYADIHNPIFNLITKYYKEYHTNPNPTPPTNSVSLILRRHNKNTLSIVAKESIIYSLWMALCVWPVLEHDQLIYSLWMALCVWQVSEHDQ